VRYQRLRRAGATLALVLAALAVMPAVWAQEPAFTETFDDPDLPGWDRVPGASAEDGVLRIEPGGFASHGEPWGDLTLTVRLRRSGEGAVAVIYRASDAGSYILLVETDFLGLQREAGGTLAELGRAPLAVAPGEWVSVGVTVSGTEHTVHVEGEPVLNAVDPEPLPPGGVVFETIRDATGEFDDLTVTLAGEPGVEPRPVQPAGDLAWVRTGGPLGGLGYDVRMRPDEPDVMYVTDAWAGVHISTDGGQTWFPSNEGITTRTGESGDAIPVFCLTIDPHDPDIIWIGTQHLRGIFKSTDGGRTWVEMDDGVVELEGITFRGITVDPRSSDVVYAAAEISSWAWAQEEQPGREFDKTRGVVYRTTDGGQNWTAIWRGDNLARYVWIDPGNSDVIYISTGIFDREAANSDHQTNAPGGEGVLRSTDGGATWQPVNEGIANLYVGTLFMHPQDPGVLLAGAGNNAYPDGGGVYLTTDGGTSWEAVVRDENINAVEFALSAPNVAYAGSEGAVYRSEDGGRSWDRVSGGEHGWGPPGVRAGFPIDFQVDPRDPNRIFANNYGGGNFLSSDGGRTWTIASAGYTGAQVRDITVDPADPARVYAAARSGMFVSPDGGGTWAGLGSRPAFALEWNAIAVDPADSRHLLAGTNWDGLLFESRDGGASWQQVSQSPGPGTGWSAIAFAPTDSRTVYAGTSGFFSAGVFDIRRPAAGVFVSHDGGASWTPANGGQAADANVTALAVDPRDPQVVYAATGNRGVLGTTDGGQSWTPPGQGLPESLPVLSVAIHPSQPGVVYAGLERAGLYRSGDGGATWQPASAGLNPESRATDVLFDPGDPQAMFLADVFSGVYRSTDAGATWLPLNDGLRTRAVNELALSADGLHLYAATEGEGVFRLDLNGAPPQPAGEEPGDQAAPGAEETAPPEAPPPTAALPVATEAPEPLGGGGPCSGAAILPLALLVLVRLRRRR
jgi:photosystem II stability/assembly factor-like uncharacterized protein